MKKSRHPVPGWRMTCAATLGAIAMSGAATPAMADESEWSVARIWNEENLDAIRNDFAKPPISARNLYHVSAAMWDAWAVYSPTAQGIYTTFKIDPATVDDVQAAREEAISYAAYRVIKWRFATAANAEVTLESIDQTMLDLGFDPTNTSAIGTTPSAVGNGCANNVIWGTLFDGALELLNYEDPTYEPVNPAVIPNLPGLPDVEQWDPNRWAEIILGIAVDQLGNVLDPGAAIPFIGPHWGFVEPFALTAAHGDPSQGLYLDPGPPPMLGADEEQTAQFIEEFVTVIEWQSHVDPDQEIFVDTSPAVWGNNPLGTNDGEGHGTINPVTGEPYEPNVVNFGDYTRIVAEFWADGPLSSMPPGHWNEIANEVSDIPGFEHRIGGTGPIVDRLQWDVKMYLAVNGAMHDVAIACWGVKGFYDWTRPIFAIRYMAEHGQSSDPELPNYHPHGLPLIDGLIELITEETAAPGGKHHHLAEIIFDPETGMPMTDPDTFEILFDDFVGELAVFAWPGTPVDDLISDWPFGFPNEAVHPDFALIGQDTGGVMWIRAKRWIPYQALTFVTPPFAGYTSGHSTYSRAAAEVMTLLTGSEYFPNGLFEYHIEPGWLHFEFGPSEPLTLQWATYYDGSDQASQSRLYGGIHPPVDDFPARIMGSQIGPIAYNHAEALFGEVEVEPCLGDLTGAGAVGVDDLLILLAAWGDCPRVGECPADLTGAGAVGVDDLLILLANWGACP